MAHLDLLPYLLSPSGIEHYEQHEVEYHKAFQNSGRRLRCFIADLDHNVGHGPRVPCDNPEAFPVALCHHTFYDFVAGRFITEKEVFGSQGLDVYSSLAGLRPLVPILDKLETMPLGKQQKLNGNAFNIRLFGSWMFYVFSHCVRRSDFFHSPVVQMSSRVEDEDLDK